HEVMQAREDLQRRAPAHVLSHELDEQRVILELGGEPRVERRRPGEMPGLLPKRLAALHDYAWRADLALSAIAPNAAGSLTARSASTFRSSSIPALLHPLMNWLYERPCARAAALIRVIQSLRNSRLRTFR